MSPQTAEMLPSCSGGPAYIGWGRECSHQSQGPVAEEFPLPQCQTTAWHSLTPGRNIQERWYRPHCSPASRILKLQRNWKGHLSLLLSQDRVLCQQLTALTMGDTLLLTAPMAGKFLLRSNFSQRKSICNSVPLVLPRMTPSVAVWKEVEDTGRV